MRDDNFYPNLAWSGMHIEQNTAIRLKATNRFLKVADQGQTLIITKVTYV